MRALCVWLVMLCGACSFERAGHPDACASARNCAGGRTCADGFCVLAGGSSGGTEGARCENGTAPSICYEGDVASEGKGTCRAGQRFCSGGILTKCFDQVLPSVEVCNGQDDDCNGQDDDIAHPACAVQMGASCIKDGLRVCRNGAASCELAMNALDEVCNGQDDDCDGKIDEVPSTPCYPMGQPGCALDPMGTLQCKGVCVVGMSECNAGVPSCKAAVLAKPESCEGPSEVAYDDDCDGNVDEACPCSANPPRSCYAGPKGSDSKGACVLGSQSCNAGTWAACSGQGLPSPEACDNQGNDDDCNGTTDDIVGLGMPCIDFSTRGECRAGTSQCVSGLSVPICRGQAATTELCDLQDQDCDGDPLNGFDLNSDSSCGACGVSCSGLESCCAGECKSQPDLDVDENNCGACGNPCGSNQYCCQGECLSISGFGTPSCACSSDCGTEACCGSACVDLTTDSNNCGACGRRCSSSGRGGSRCRAGVCD